MTGQQERGPIEVGPIDIEASRCYGCLAEPATVVIMARDCIVALRLCDACTDAVRKGLNEL